MLSDTFSTKRKKKLVSWNCTDCSSKIRIALEHSFRNVRNTYCAEGVRMIQTRAPFQYQPPTNESTGSPPMNAHLQKQVTKDEKKEEFINLLK